MASFMANAILSDRSPAMAVFITHLHPTPWRSRIACQTDTGIDTPLRLVIARA
jgi:hypothetical protein